MQNNLSRSRLPQLLIAGVLVISAAGCSGNAPATPVGSPSPSRAATSATGSPSATKSRSIATPSMPVKTPASAVDGAMVIGQASAPVTVSVYSDFLCPFCGTFEATNGAMLQKYVTEGKIKVAFYPLTFLDRLSQGTQYSTRTANDFVAVAQDAPATALAFSAALFANQPTEGKAGLTDSQIIDLAIKAGVPQTVTDTFKDQTYVPWTQQITQEAFGANPISGTPTAKINGTTFTGDLYTAGPLEEAIKKALTA